MYSLFQEEDILTYLGTTKEMLYWLTCVNFELRHFDFGLGWRISSLGRSHNVMVQSGNSWEWLIGFQIGFFIRVFVWIPVKRFKRLVLVLLVLLCRGAIVIIWAWLFPGIGNRIGSISWFPTSNITGGGSSCVCSCWWLIWLGFVICLFVCLTFDLVWTEYAVIRHRMVSESLGWPHP